MAIVKNDDAHTVLERAVAGVEARELDPLGPTEDEQAWTRTSLLDAHKLVEPP